MRFFKYLWPKKVLTLPRVALWGGMSFVATHLLWSYLPGRAVASSSPSLALWQSLWLGGQKFLRYWADARFLMHLLVLVLVLAWGVLFCWCLNYGLGQSRDNFLPPFKPTPWACFLGGRLAFGRQEIIFASKNGGQDAY